MLGTCQKSSRSPDCYGILALFPIFTFGSGNRLLISAPLFLCLSTSSLWSLSRLQPWKVHGEELSGLTLCSRRVSRLLWCWCGTSESPQGWHWAAEPGCGCWHPPGLLAGGGGGGGGMLCSRLCPFTRTWRVSGLPAAPHPRVGETGRCSRSSWDGGCRIQVLEPFEDPVSVPSHQGKLQVRFAALVQRDAGKLSLWMGWCPGVPDK